MSLSSPATIAHLALPNRLLMAPVKSALGAKGGAVTDPLIAYYQRRVAGGVGAIIAEPLFVDPRGKEHPKQLGIESDARVAGLRRLTDAVHAGGGLIFAHLNHAGRAANPKASGQPPEAPSAMRCGATGATAEALAAERIEALIAAYGAAARRAREAGFDAIELQCGLGYLIAQFWSPRCNQRRDAYGGDAAGRERFAAAVVAAVRREVGPDLPLLARISADEKINGGLDLPAAQAMARKLQSWGVAALHVVSGSACDSPPWYYQHMSLPDGANEALAAAIKQVAKVPVIVAGRLAEPARIRRVLDEGLADFVALGRPLLADPDLPRKLFAGEDERVIQCGSCLQGCLAGVKAGGPIGCIVNPETGLESELPAVSQARRDSAFHLVIVGGGPAGMTAAIQGRRRGYRVTLFERGRLGGQFALAPLAPGKAALARPLESLVRLTRASGAEIHEQQVATADQLQALHPSRILLATGARPQSLDLPGFEQALAGDQVLSGAVSPGERVLVVGGGLIGIEVAEWLALRGHRVTVVEILEEIARDMEMVTRKLTLARLRREPVEIRTGTRILAFNAGLARISDSGGEKQIGPYDSLVVAVGTQPERRLARELEERGLTAELVGDAAEIGQVMGAVRGAWRAIWRAAG